MLKRLHFNGLKEQSKIICTTDIIHNKVRSEFYINGYPQSFASTVKTYNKQGKEVERWLKYPSKPVEINKSAYDDEGNRIGLDAGSYKIVMKYDKDNFLIEQLFYDKNGKLYFHDLYKNDQWGNPIEEKSSIDEGEFTTSSISYIYDQRNNWIKRIRSDRYGRKVVTRTIEYY